MTKLSKHQKIYLVPILIIIVMVGFWFASKKQAENLYNIYESRASNVITDRYGELIYLETNDEGYYADYQKNFKDEIKQAFILKEDKYFKYHPGFNPVSITRALKDKLIHKSHSGASTITQQLAKILLANEQDRTLKNKIKEFGYALSLETHFTKDEIITMYLNSIFLGNNTQGIEAASQLYFDKSASQLSKEEIYRLVATVSNPSNLNPFKKDNINSTKIIANRLEVAVAELDSFTADDIREKSNDFYAHYKNDSFLEVNELIDCRGKCRATIDNELNKTVREVVYKNISELINKDAFNAAVVVIKYPENELLAIVGSPKTDLNAHGYQINMATKERPIGSTVKPFIYMKGFENDLRPYSLIDDREYKYTIGSGYAFYPKNYDYEYRGVVNLHYALSNSLNVPTVKVLEYVGLENFYNFFENDMEFKPVNDWQSYQLGIALGGLDMDLLTLCHYFTIFANDGSLRPLGISQGSNYNDFNTTKKITVPAYTQLVNKILNDRETGTEQFGAKSNLNLLKKNYAVKTGTSREYHDSWTIGYTPDFLVGVWVGNSDDSAMDHISGQSGAGQIWHEVMNLLYNSEYNFNTPFDFDLLEEYEIEESVVYGLPHDDFEVSRNLLMDDVLIIKPHDGDTILLEDDTKIILRAKKEVSWYINEDHIAIDKEYIFEPKHSGLYLIEARSDSANEFVTIRLKDGITP